MAAVSRAVRTPWVDLNVFAVLAISYTGTKRTVLVSQCLVLYVRHNCEVLPSRFSVENVKMTSHILDLKLGIKNRRYFEMFFFSL